jgi:PAS domain S-box-containing protein
MNPFRRRRLRFQLTWRFLLMGLLPSVVLGAVAVGLTRAAMHRSVDLRNAAVAQAIAGEVDQFLGLHRTHLTEVALWGAARAGGSTALDQEHATLHLRANAALRSILLLDANGRIVFAAPASPDLVGTDFSGQPFVREARVTGRPTWSSATISIETGQPTVTLVVPGKPWSAIGYLDLGALAEIAGRASLGAGVTAAVVDRDGTIIAHGDERLVRQQTNIGDVDVVARALDGEERTGAFRFEGRDWLASAAPVSATRWAVVAMTPSGSAYAAADALGTVLLLSAVGTAALALLLALAFARRLQRPVEALGASARALAAGEPPPPLPGRRLAIEEFEELGRHFDAMAAAVRAREKALARSERGYRRIVEAPLLLVARTSTDGTILFANEGLARLNGLREPAQLVGRSFLDLYADPREREEIVRCLGAGVGVANRLLRLRTLPGAERVVLANFARDDDGITAVLLDVTEQRRAEEERARLEQQLVHSQKVEAVGRLAGGVAHDFNNLLTAIIGYASVLREDLPADAGAREAIEGILQASDRAAHLTRSLLAYSRKQVLARRPLDLRDVVREATRLIGRVLGEDVRLSTELTAEPLPILADAGQVDQVLMNLCTNARDAMPSGGTLRIRAERVILDAAEAHDLELPGGGAFARLRVSDTGVGMTPETVARVFEPFFTTKPTGKGTGLGLPIVQGIVRQHDGAVQVASEPGRGTSVSVLLPLRARDEEAYDRGEEGTIGGAPRGTELLLLCEDDAQVRRVVRSVLERGGYRVLEAANGRDGVELFAARHAEIALCLFDVVMPELNGREALQAIRRIDPAARVLFSSGYAGDVLAERTAGDGIPDVIAKPVSPAELLRKVREVLDRPAPPP